MFFRRGLILLALGLVASSGCREKVASSVAADSGPGCLAGATDTVRAFLTGTDTSHRMPGVFDCIQQSLDMFEAKAVGANPDSFSLQELRNVLQTFFVRPDQFKISDELIGEVKTLKRSLFGDHQDSFTKKELAQIRKILAVLKQGAIDLGPYMPLTPGHVGHLKREEFKLALGALANFASNLAAQINPSDEPYSFSHLDHLLAIFTRDGNIEPKESLLQSLRERIPLARAFKIAFLDPNPDLITSDNRRDFVQFAQAWFRVLLKMGYLGEHYPSWNHGEGLEYFFAVADEARANLEASLETHPDRRISFQVLDSLIDALKPGELKLSDTLIFTQATLKNTLRPLFQKILGNKNTLGLDHAVLHELWLQFDYWHVSQHYLEGAFLQLQGDLPEGSIRGSMVPEEILSVPLNTIFTDPKLLSQAQDKISFVQSILQNPLERAVFEGDDGEMSFAFNRSDLRHSYHDWAQKIWMHRVARVLLNSYSRPGESSVDVSAFKQFYADFKEIGVELRFFMQNDDGRDIPSRFREANLFTFSGNGDSRLDESELSQLFTFILSSKNMGDRVHKIAAQKCSSGKLDSAGEPMLFADCFRLRYFSQFERIYAQMPELAKAYRELYQDSSKYNERMAFEQNLIQGAFGTQLITQVDSAGSQTMAMISHYVEALFARFDVNDDGVLDHAEGEEAFRVFEPMITRLIREKLGQGSRSDAACPPYPDPQWVPRAVFMYMLAKGHLPEDGAKGMMDLNNFNNLEWNWGKMIHADRARVLSIFAAINPKKDPSASPRIFPEGCFDLVR